MQAGPLLKRLNDRLGEYLREDIRRLGLTRKSFIAAIKEGGSVFGWWALPAASFVYLTRKFQDSVPRDYFELAISEGIGPHLWNVIGVLGLVLVGLLLLFPRSKFLAKPAYQVLSNTFAMGGLTFGLVMGKVVFGMSNESADVEAWRLWLSGVGSLILTVQVLFLNFALWCLACVAKPNEFGLSAASQGVSQVRLPLRMLAFMAMSVFSMVALMAER